MTDIQKRYAMWFVVGLLVIYVLPLVIGVIAAMTGGLKGDEFAGDILMTLMTSPGGVWALLQKSIAPIVGAITVAALWTGKTKPAVIIFWLSVIGFIAALFLWYVIRGEGAAELYQNFELPGVKLRANSFQLMSDQYLSGIAESLLLIVGMILGVSLGKRKGQHA